MRRRSGTGRLIGAAALIAAASSACAPPIAPRLDRPRDIVHLSVGPRAAAGARRLQIDRLPGLARLVIRQALANAARDLDDPDCQQVLGDFRDGRGRPLWTDLAASGLTPPEFLSSLWFVDSTGAGLCRTDDSAAAYTTPGSHVVFVCGRRFGDSSFPLRGPRGEAVIIHEMLHALGLGENPPTTDQITQRVIARCATGRRRNGHASM